MKMSNYIESGAGISNDGVYRYRLWRQWDHFWNKPTCAFAMLNPSTADADLDDPTIRRCIDFARRWGYATLSVVNLFPFRATDPRELKAWLTCIEEETERWRRVRRNWVHIETVAGNAALVVLAWGNHGDLLGMGRVVTRRLIDSGNTPHVLGWTKAGQPLHPLYVPADTRPQWIDPEEYGKEETL